MIQIQTIGLIVNSLAGAGANINLMLARKGIIALGVRKVITGSGSTGADAMTGTEIETSVYQVDERPSRKQTLELASILAEQKIDAVMVVGGDGTLADVASVFSQYPVSPPIIGIGAGSTNAGALVTCTASQIDSLNPSDLTITTVDALIAYDGNSQIGIGFNDCALGFTVVATIDGKLRDVAVADKFFGKNVPTHPATIGLPQTNVKRVSHAGSQIIASGEEVGTVILGLAEASFIAKAITGGVCLTSFSGLKAGCLVANQPLVRVELDPSEVLALPVVRSSYISLGNEDRIVVSGVREGTGLCVDGTPLRILSDKDEISFGVKPNIICSVKFEKSQRGAL